MRMDEEDIVKEKVRCKQREDEENRRVNTDSKRLSEMTRAEKNKAWRMRQEEQMMNNWREVEHRVREELCCPCCAEEMTPPSRIYQCRDGHVVCQQCFQHKHIEVFFKIFHFHLFSVCFRCAQVVSIQYLGGILLWRK